MLKVLKSVTGVKWCLNLLNLDPVNVIQALNYCALVHTTIPRTISLWSPDVITSPTVHRNIANKQPVWLALVFVVVQSLTLVQTGLSPLRML